MYEHTPNLKHTIVNKGSMKALQRFIQIEMKEHDCCLANLSMASRQRQLKLATWHKIFQRSSSHSLEFCKAKSSLDGCDSMLHDGWLDIPGFVILHSFCFKPRMVSDKNTQRNIFTIIFLGLFHKGITTEGENSYYLSKVLALGQRAHPRETF